METTTNSHEKYGPNSGNLVDGLRRIAERYERNGKGKNADFYNEAVQNSLSVLMEDLGLDYVGIWVPSGDSYAGTNEVGTSLYLNAKACARQIREAVATTGDYYICPSDSRDGGVDAVFKFSDVSGEPFAFVLLDDVENVREMSGDEIRKMLENYHRHVHIILLESQVLGLRERISVLNAKLSEAVESSNVDHLTELYNRRHMEALLVGKIRDLRLSSNPDDAISICMSDIDDFKVVNDTYGHPVGDVVLKRVADIVNVGYHGNGFAHTRRPTDHFGRFGGEEYMFVLEKTAMPIAVSFAEKIRKIVESVDFEDESGERFKVTISVGVSEITKADSESLGGDEARILEFLKAKTKEADDRLYEAKRT